jgi:hypothetical protein
MLYTFGKTLALGEIGAKLPMLMNNITAYPTEKHYVYSAFNYGYNGGWGSQGILTIAKLMERDLGYKAFDVAKDVEFKKEKKPNGEEEWRIVRLPNKAKRFILVTSKEIGESSSGPSKKAGDKLAKMLAIFNHPDNRYGEIVHVMLASNNYNEGIDLKAVRHIHFFEPLVTMASDKQTIGRASRFCSHATLNRAKGEWTVAVHRYMSHYPVNIELNTSPRMENSITMSPPQGPTNLENEKISKVEAEISDLNVLLDETNKQLEQFKKPSKDANTKLKKDELKTKVQDIRNLIKEKQAEIKGLKTVIEKRDKDAKKATAALAKKKRNNVDLSSVKMIDEFIFNESREHMKAILTIYKSMKEAAIDCRLLDKFHNNMGDIIKCEPYETMPQDFKAKNTSVLDAWKSHKNKFFF